MDIGIDTVRIALQSMWLGMILSLVLMVIATLGVIPAILGATLQEVVDLATILNALRAVGATRQHAGQTWKESASSDLFQGTAN